MGLIDTFKYLIQPKLAVSDTTPIVFKMKARIVRWIDADTVLVHPMVYRQDIDLRVRLKDVWMMDPPDGEELRRQIELLGDVGGYVWLTNTRHHWTYGRLEARVDKA